MSLRKACELENLSAGRFINWVNSNDDLAKRYSIAMQVRADTLFDNMLNLSDEMPLIDSNNGRLDNAAVHWQKLKIDTRKWVLARMAPKKYLASDVHNNIDVVIEI